MTCFVDDDKEYIFVSVRSKRLYQLRAIKFNNRSENKRIAPGSMIDFLKSKFISSSTSLTLMTEPS